jgi:hypothetical protein
MPKSRAEAKAAGATHYFTGEPCKHGHVAPRKTKGACVECSKVEQRASNEKRAEYFKQYNKSEAGQEAKKRYYKANRNAVIARAQARPAEEKQAYRNQWKKGHVVQVLADNKVRRKKHRQATPPWVTRAEKSEMRKMYQMAIEMTRITGVAYVVDHDYPLRSELVCGLHVPSNLKVIPREENLRKSNKFTVDWFSRITAPWTGLAETAVTTGRTPPARGRRIK